jgi:periplasmic divalent cation tolerance protein
MDPAKPLVLVISTFPDLTQARQIGTALIQCQLAACVNFLPAILSVYRWQGEIHHDEEVLAIFKTQRPLLPALQQALLDAHPYETPEIIAVSPESVSPAYLAWVTAATTR